MRFTENGNNLLSIYDKYRYKAIDSSKVKSTQKGNLHLGKCSSSHKVKQLGKTICLGMSEDGTCICGITSNQKLFIQNWTTKLNKEYEISDTVIDFFKFPKQSKVMIRRREAGLGLFDQISNLHQHLYISNTGDFVIFVSRKGVIFFDVASNKWKQVSNFKNEIHFEFDVKFEYQNEVTAAIKIILGMKQRIGRYSDKLEIQYTILDVSREVQSIKIANLIHVIKVPFEFMDQPDSSITQPLIMKILKEK